MESTTITIRTEKDLKDQATELFNSLGMSLSAAINMFMRQAVIKQAYPCSLELSVASSYEASYPPGFFSIFGSGRELGLDEEAEEISFEKDALRESV